MTRSSQLQYDMRLQALEAAFLQFGPVAKAVVVSDAHANTSRRLVAPQGCAAVIFTVSLMPIAARERRCARWSS